MTNRNTIVPILIAALLISLAGPAMAKKQGSGDVSSVQKQTKRQAVKECRRMPPPFMYNPRFMNRGFFKQKCRAQNQ